MDGTVLVADDDRTIRTVLTQALTRAGCKVHATASMATLLGWIEEGRGDAVITDVVMPDGNGLKALPRILDRRPDLPVIVISAQNTIMTAIEAENAKAWDYLPKPFDLPDLLARTARALDHRPAQVEPDPAEQLPLVGQSAPMQALYRTVAKVMESPLPVLVVGEIGAGKSRIAEVLHQHSSRRDLPLVVVRPGDEAQLPARGTLVLEDIGALDEPAQTRVFEMLARLDPAVRVVATATGDPLAQGLRSDLFFRLSGLTLTVPPLRERVSDIPLHASAVLAPTHSLAPDALAPLVDYAWPGNLRQFVNVMQALALTAGGPRITGDDVRSALAAQPQATVEVEAESLSGAIERHLARYFDMHGATLPPPGLYARILREMELPLLTLAMGACGGNQAQCAQLLGINRNTLRKKLTERDIEVTRSRKMM